MDHLELELLKAKKILKEKGNTKLSGMISQLEQINWQSTIFSVIENADANILLLDLRCRVMSINPAFYWIFSETYGIELKLNASIVETMEAVNPTLALTWKERCERVADGESLRFEDSFELHGRTYHWEVYYKKVLHEETPYISVFSRDITVKKAWQQRTISNEANLRSILNSIDDGVWLVNEKCELIDYNREFYQKYQAILNIKPIKGKCVLELLPEDKQAVRDLWKMRYETGLTGKVMKYLDTYTVSGEKKMYELKIYPIRDDGKVTGLTMLARDVTKVRETEDQLKAQNEELTKINSELDRFVYSASHDLRAPLRSVKGLLNMVKLDQDGANTEKYLQLIEKSIDKLDSFITDIVHHSRNSRLEILAKEIDFTEVINNSIESLKYMDDADKVQSIISVDATHKFYSDDSRLSIIFNNIISNAVSYRDKHKESFIKIDVQVLPRKAVIKFSDNGIGVAEAYQQKIFKMFFRASADSKGSGLGLYIVKAALDKLSGKIKIDSELGVGSTFTLEIPSLEPALHQQNLN
jgi:PAS domain S-box-containing protein